MNAFWPQASELMNASNYADETVSGEDIDHTHHKTGAIVGSWMPWCKPTNTSSFNHVLPTFKIEQQGVFGQRMNDPCQDKNRHHVPRNAGRSQIKCGQAT